MQWPWKSSLLLLIFGFLVVFFSLQSQHGKVIAQEVNAFPDVDDETQVLAHWFDEKLPGSFPYQLERVADRVKVETTSQTAQRNLHCELAAKRLEASRYAWEKNHVRLAITTLHKSYIYLSQAKSLDEGQPMCSEIADQIQETAQKWCESLDCPENSILAKTRSQSESLF